MQVNDTNVFACVHFLKHSQTNMCYATALRIVFL